MHILLRCSHCKDASLISFAQLCSIWKRGYDSMSDKNKRGAHVNTSVECSCGHTDTYDSPMFHYVFQLIFDEIVRKQNV